MSELTRMGAAQRGEPAAANPAVFGNFQLQENTNVSLANDWSAVAAPRSTNSGSISVAFPAAGDRIFFRLRANRVVTQTTSSPAQFYRLVYP